MKQTPSAFPGESPASRASARRGRRCPAASWPAVAGFASVIVLAGCGEDSIVVPDGDARTLSDTISGAATALAAEAVPRVAYEPREEDFSDDHPDLPGVFLSHSTLIASLTPTAAVGPVNGLLREVGAAIVASIPGVAEETGAILFLRLEDPGHAEMESALDVLRASPLVGAASQDAVLAATVAPEPSGAFGDWGTWDTIPTGGNWGMEAVRAPQLWNLNAGVRKNVSSGEVLLVLDGGFAGGNNGHEDLLILDLTPGSRSSHGVAVAGVAGAIWENGKGLNGIDPFVSLMGDATTLSLSGTDNVTWGKSLIDDLEQLIRDHTPRVVNVSLGFDWDVQGGNDTKTDAAIQKKANEVGEVAYDMLASLEADGFALPFITQASGNESNDGQGLQPAVYGSPLGNAALAHGAANIVVVEATTRGGAWWEGSNTGGHVSAPGAEVTVLNFSSTSSTAPRYAAGRNGTSYAAPMVAGLTTYLYTLARAAAGSGLPAPTLSSNPVRDLLMQTGTPVAGGAKQIDAFAAAMDLDRVLGGDNSLRLLVDVDDGSPDGNLRLDPETRAQILLDDIDLDGGIGDGAVDMSDFRVWRDAYLMTSQPAGWFLDGPPTHPKGDLNGDGAAGDDGTFARVDFNGDGVVHPTRTRLVPGVIGGEASDLDVLGRLFDDPHYAAADLEALKHSGDIVIDPSFVLTHPETQSLRSFVYRASDRVLVGQRVHSGTSAGEEAYQIYTVPGAAAAPDNRYLLRIEAVDAGATVIFTDSTFKEILPGDDQYWNPQCATDETGQPTGETGRGTLCIDVVVSPKYSFLLSGDQQLFEAGVTRVADQSVSWTVRGSGSITSGGLYTGPALSEGTSVLDTVVVTSVAEPTLSDTALITVSAPRIQSGGSPCTPSPADDCGRTGKSWGDPHLLTPDGYNYDFMASGDFILARSTEPGDGFEVQLRFIEPNDHETFSWNSGAAMRVEGNVVEIFVEPDGSLGASVNASPTLLDGGFVDLDGGSITTDLSSLVVSWPDGSQLVAKPSNVPNVISEIRLTLAAERAGTVEGLFGDFDGNPGNDLRVRGGPVLVNPSTAEIYNEFRESWWVRAGTTESLFSGGQELFNPRFPPRLVSIADLDVDEVGHGQAVCTEAGVLDLDVLRGCILDVVLTGDDSWALVSAGVDPNTLGMRVSPAAAFLAPGDQRDFGAIVSGTTDRRVEWSATGGTVTSIADNRMTYTAPDEPGTYTITARLVADGSVVSTAIVRVTGAPSGFSKVWTGSVNNDWTRAENWLPAGVPDSTDNVLVPADADRSLRILSSSYVVNDLRIEDGSIYGGGTRRITARGNAHVESEWIDLVLRGLDKTVHGRMNELWVDGTAIVADTLEVIERLLLRGGSLTVGPRRIEAGQLAVSTGGRLVMRNPAGHVLTGSASFSGSQEPGSLTAGTVEVYNGNLVITHDAAQFNSTQEHRILMSGDGSVQGRLSPVCSRCWDLLNPPTNWLLNDIEFANPAGVILGGQMPFRVDGVIVVTAGTVTGDGALLHLFGGILDEVGGWNAGLVVRDPAVLLPARVGGDLQIGYESEGGAVEMTLTSDLDVGGKLTVMNGSALSLGGHTVRVEGELGTQWSGGLIMDSAADTLVALGPTNFGQGNVVGGSGAALFSAGLFDVRGDFLDNFNHFTSSGTNVTRFSGSVAQAATFYCPSCVFDPASPRRFQNVEITSPVGVTFLNFTASVAGTLSIAPDARATFDTDVFVDQSLDLAGTLTVNTTRMVTIAGSLLLRATAVLNNDGTVTTGSCQTEAGYTVNGTDPCGS